MEEDLPRPLPTQRPRTAGARLSRVRSEHPDSSRQRFDRDPVFLHQIRRRQSQPQPPQQQQSQNQQQPQQTPGLQRAPGTDRNAQTHTLGEQIHPGDVTPVEENDVSLSLHNTARAARGSQPPGEVKDKLRVVEVTGGKLEAAHVYRHYFEIHKHGGEVTDVKVDEENKVVFVTFVSHEVAQKVVQDEHMIGNQVVQVKLSDGTYSPPPDYYVDKLFFSNVDVDKDKDHLSLYFGKVSGCDPIEDQILYGDTKGDVLVTFQQPPDEEKTMANCRRLLLANRQVMVSRVSRSKCVIVENLNPKSTEDGIRNFFENPNTGGAPVHDLKFSLDRRRCFVYFGSSEVAERIAARPRKLDGSSLNVKIYMECLGPSAGGFDPRDFYFPESFSVNGADPLVCKFFRETKKVQCQWSKRFKKLHAGVDFGATENDPIVVSCTLEKTNPKFRLLAEGWKAKVDVTVEDMLAAVGTGTVEVLPHSWADVENYIKGKLDLNRDTAILITVEDKKTITVVGLNTKLDKNLKKVRKAVANIEENNMKRKKENVKLTSDQISLLEKCGFFQITSEKFKKFKINRNVQKGTVSIEGTLVDIREAGWDMQKLLQTVTNRQITRLKDIQRALLDKDSTVQSIEASLQKEKVVAIWEKVKKEVKVYAFGEEALQVAEKAICKQVSMEKCSLSAESTELLDTSKFKETLQQLKDKHPGRLLIEPNVAEKKIVMAGYFARETRTQIEAYMLENTIYFETVSFSASRQAIISTEWREKLNTIQSEHRTYMVAISFGEEDRVITVKGTSRGLKEVRARLEQLGQQILCHVEQLTQPEKIKYLYSKKCEKLRNSIVQSNHCVISLEQEPAGLQVLQSTRPPTPKPETEDITDDEETEDITDDEETDENDDLSDDSSEKDTVIEGASGKASPKKLTKPRRHRRPKAVSEEEMAPESEAEGEGPQEARKSVHDKIVIMTADITDMPMPVDAIVNAANSRLEHAGGLAKVIVQKGGQIIQDESRSIMRSRSKELDEGEVVPTGPGQLPCREIFHAVGPRYKDGRRGESERLALAVKNCLQLAWDRGYQTIAIPALSTGIFKYPVEEASWVIVKAGKEFLENEPDCCLETVILCDTSDDKVRHFRSAKEALFSSDHKGNQYDRQAGSCPKRPATSKGGTRFPAVPPDVPDIFHQPQTMDELQAAQAFPLGPPLQGTGSTIITLSVVKGEIAKQKANAIVNSVGKDADLNRGAVSRTLLQLAGPELQAELRANYPQQLQFGDVAITSGHRLQCRHVLHVCLSGWSAQSSVQLLQQVMSKCLWEADQRGCVSIAFPALGTGILKFPEAVVAQTMLQAVHHFEQAHPATPLRKVTMVIYPKDQHIFQAFEHAKNQAGAGPSSPGPALLIHEHSPRGVEPGRHLSPGLPDSESDMPIAYHQDRTFPENHDCQLEARESKEYELLEIRIIVKQGRKESESVDAIVVYGDPRHPQEGNHENLEVLTANAAAHNGDWKKCLIHCLREAAEKKYKMISLDSPPTKKGHLEADRFAEVLFNAITEAHEDLDNVLREITIVFMDQRDITIFIMTMEKEGHLYNQENPVKDDMWSPTKKRFETCERTTRLPENVSLYIYATNEGHIRQFREDFEDFVRQIFTSETWKEQQLMKKNETVFEKIHKVAKYNDVKMTMDRQKGTLTLHGFKEDVYQAKDDIKEIFRKAMQAEHEEEKKEIYANFAQWSYLREEKGKGSERVEYLKEQNSIIEKAFQAKDKTVKIRSNNGDTYVIDFDNMVAYPETNHQDKVSVLRQVKIHDKNEVQMPDTWSDHSQQELVKLVPLSPSSPEFTAVSGNFMATIGARQLTIVEITRIQNRTLYKQYQVKKTQMETQNQDVQNVQNEKLVWHGTAKEATDNINNHGFNRSYCGKNATVHGLGVYFAVNSDYSARNTYSPPDADGKRYMYQSRVLVGVSCSSNKDMRFLPARAGNVLYDSACDDVNNPGIYVIFHDTQAYPEYLVSFKDA